MSPIITTMSSPAGRSRRVKAPSVGGGSPGASTGPGANAPAWSGKTVYTAEDFASDIPVSPTAANAAGFRGFYGFGSTLKAGPQRVSYPTVDTPLGSKRVMRVTYHGQSETLSALNATTTPWEFSTSDADFYAAAIRLGGTWTGTVAFEVSTDGGSTWNAVSMIGVNTAELGSATSGTSATTKGLWRTPTSGYSATALFRARCSAYTSGTIEVRVGFLGGWAAATFTGGTFTSTPTRIYTRMLYRVSDGWSNGGNAGTKFFFFSKSAGGGQTTNHFVNLSEGSQSDQTYPLIGLQPGGGWGSSSNYYPTQAFPNGAWRELEFVAEAGTAGNADGVAKLWIDGTLVIDRSDMPYFGSLMTPGFTGLQFDPTFGGGGFPPPAPQYFELAYCYRESAA